MRVKKIADLSQGWHSYGEGLYCRVQGDARAWILRFQQNKKRKVLTLGDARFLNLQGARDLVFQLKKDMASGGDPILCLDRLLGREKHEEEVDQGPLFSEIWEDALADIALVKAWRSAKAEQHWRATIVTHMLPKIGHIPVKELTRDHFINMLKPIWWTKNSTATKVIGRAVAIIDWCKAKGFYEGDNPALWRGNLSLSLPPPSRVHTITPHRTIHWRELPDFIADMWERNTVGSIAVVFGCLTASRCEEFVLARWEEFDKDANLWRMPAARRKDGKPFEHRVPMNKYTWACLERVKKIPRTPCQKPYVFPGRAGNKTIALGTPAITILRAAYDCTMHGLRSTFLDWVADTKGSNYIHAAEKALSHAVGDKVTQAYLRTDKLDERIALMEEFGAYCFSRIESRFL